MDEEEVPGRATEGISHVTSRVADFAESSLFAWDVIQAGIADAVSEVMIALRVQPVSSQIANAMVINHHYLHRKTSISFAYGLYKGPKLLGVVTFGTPPSRHLQISACRSDPSKVLELNRLWVDDVMPRNTESWFVSRALKLLPPHIVVTYADPLFGHYGYIYRALNFHYAGWTDMERKTPRYDYVPIDTSKHTRDAFRTGIAYRVRRIPKVKYWTVTGPDRTTRRALEALCGWPKYDWKELIPPRPSMAPPRPDREVILRGHKYVLPQRVPERGPTDGDSPAFSLIR